MKFGRVAALEAMSSQTRSSRISTRVGVAIVGLLRFANAQDQSGYDIASRSSSITSLASACLVGSPQTLDQLDDFS